MGLGYPGGPIIDRLATDGNPDFYQFPRALDKKGDYDFSFSGLKTAVRNYLKKNSEDFIQKNKNHIAASLQAAIVDILIKKTLNYAAENNIHHIVIAGGVAANSRLRHLLQKNLKPDLKIYLPELQYCMDNAAMIGAAAVDKYTKKDFADYKLNAFSKKGLRIL